MITHLHIENYALIEQLDLDLDEGFSVITGETGAGKSILLGALGLLLGKRADTKSIKADAKKCVIEAEFEMQDATLQQFFDNEELDFDGQHIIVRRELTSSGKSRSFVNDTPVGLGVLSQLGNYLIDIHSQHQNLLINREDYQISVLDALGQNADLLQQYQTAQAAWNAARKALKTKQEELAAQQADQDYLQFQYDKLAEAKLKIGEQEELEQELQTLEHAEDIKQTLYQINNLLSDDEHGIVQQLRQAQRHASSIARVFSQAQEVADRLDSCYIELKDVADGIEDAVEDIEYDPKRQDIVSDRLSTIYELQQKHRVDSVDELLRLQAELGSKLQTLENQDEILRQMEADIQRHHDALLHIGTTLTAQRQAAAEALQTEMVRRLQQLGMPNVRFQADIAPTKTFERSGMDKVQFLFSANQGAAMQNISQIASGGEIARVMLSIKAILSQSTQMPTIIFDEIDTGVSGSLAESMAHTMRDMSSPTGRQVISITHLPQIAALGKQHFRVYKKDEAQGTVSHITPLSAHERIEEIAHMLSGATLTQAAIDNARELLDNKQ